MCFQSRKFQVFAAKIVLVLLALLCVSTLAIESAEWLSSRSPRQTFSLGSCKLVIDKPCPDEDVKFFLYDRRFPINGQPLHVGATLEESNITSTDFDPKHPTKIIIHGYNSDMMLNALVEIRKQYLSNYDYNVITVDWSILAPGPCYPSAVYNTRHVGKCMAQLVNGIRDLGAVDIHVIGFSLGAHVANYLANSIRPYKLPRISGLDPAMPGFTFVTKEHKLDAGDAEFVDVIHTNAFIQGKIESSGHVDFYMNGGVIQPGCWAENRFFACNHHRAPLYFAESITSDKGFWGWPCPNYFMYLIGMCRPTEPQIISGEFVNKTSTGMHLAITGSVSPFAVGKFTGPTIEIFKIVSNQRRASARRLMQMAMDDYQQEIMRDEFSDIFSSDDFLSGSMFVE